MKKLFLFHMCLIFIYVNEEFRDVLYTNDIGICMSFSNESLATNPIDSC